MERAPRGAASRFVGVRGHQDELRWREFEHGLAVVNRTRTRGVDRMACATMFDAPPGFAKLTCRQGPAHNDGAVVTGPLRVEATDGAVVTGPLRVEATDGYVHARR